MLLLWLSLLEYEYQKWKAPCWILLGLDFDFDFDLEMGNWEREIDCKLIYWSAH